MTVGYLWLLFRWSLWADHFPERQDDGPVGRLYRLSDFLGNASVIASISFLAYVVGAMLTLPTEGALSRRLRALRESIRGGLQWQISRILPNRGRVSVEMLLRQASTSHESEYRSFINEIAAEAPPQQTYEGNAQRQMDYMVELHVASTATPEQMRPRLLVSEGATQIYGEYDRAAAEASFRINITAPLFALGILGATYYSWVVFPGAILVAGTLFWQGLNRLNSAAETIERAAILGVFKHPLAAFYEQHRAGEADSGLPPGLPPNA